MRLYYYSGKVNVVADALSRKSYVNTFTAGGLFQELVDDFREFKLEKVLRGFVVILEIQFILTEKIREV